MPCLGMKILTKPRPTSLSTSHCAFRFLTPSAKWQSSLGSSGRQYQLCRDAASLLNSSDEGDRGTPRLVDLTSHVRSVRLQKRRAFVVLGDGSTTKTVQALLTPAEAAGLHTGTAIRIKGSWQPCPPSKEQTHELVSEELDILGASDPETYPIQKQYLTPEYLRTLPHLRVRTPSNALLARLRSECEYHISSYFRDKGYIRLHPPAITSSDCEGAGEVFSVRPRDRVIEISSTDSEEQKTESSSAKQEIEFFRSPKYLTVSNQLHLEAFVHEHQRVWALAPTFRAERSDTPRHLSEFYMLEAELRCTTLDKVMDVVEGLVRYVSRRIQEEYIGQELLTFASRNNENERAGRLETLKLRHEGIRRSFWPRITYTTAVNMLKEAAREDPALFAFAPDWEHGLQLEHEKYIATTVGAGSPVFVTDYPKHVKPFYMLPSLVPEERKDEGIPKSVDMKPLGRWTSHNLPLPLSRQEKLQLAHPTVSCFDLLLPDIGELVGGSMREHRHDELQSAMQNHDLNGLEWYLELRRYGSVPHGGFGLGYDRLLMYLSGAESIRDVVQWPRYYGRCDA